MISGRIHKIFVRISCSRNIDTIFPPDQFTVPNKINEAAPSEDAGCRRPHCVRGRNFPASSGGNDPVPAVQKIIWRKSPENLIDSANQEETTDVVTESGVLLPGRQQNPSQTGQCRGLVRVLFDNFSGRITLIRRTAL